MVEGKEEENDSGGDEGDEEGMAPVAMTAAFHPSTESARKNAERVL